MVHVKTVSNLKNNVNKKKKKVKKILKTWIKLKYNKGKMVRNVKKTKIGQKSSKYFKLTLLGL